MYVHREKQLGFGISGDVSSDSAVHVNARILTLVCAAVVTEQCHCVLPTQSFCVFCVDLRTKSDYFPIQH